MSLAADETLRRLTGTGAADEHTISTADITFVSATTGAGNPCVEVLVLAGSGALAWTTPAGVACAVGDGSFPLVAGSTVTLAAAKIHGTGGTSPASAALTIRVRT